VRRSDWLLAQLPMGMLDDDFFVRYTSIFQEVASTLMEGVDNLENTIDVTVAPEPMVRWLGSWIGISSIDESLPHELQRRIVRESSQILAWRATRRGLRQFLELMSGGPAEVEENGGVFAEGEAGLRAPFVTMKVGTTGHMSEGDFLSLVQDEIPADVHFELWVGERRVWPAMVADDQEALSA
jgi:phage tail-like protein